MRLTYFTSYARRLCSPLYFADLDRVTTEKYMHRYGSLNIQEYQRFVPNDLFVLRPSSVADTVALTVWNSSQCTHYSYPKSVLGDWRSLLPQFRERTSGWLFVELMRAMKTRKIESIEITIDESTKAYDAIPPPLLVVEDQTKLVIRCEWNTRDFLRPWEFVVFCRALEKCDTLEKFRFALPALAVPFALYLLCWVFSSLWHDESQGFNFSFLLLEGLRHHPNLKELRWVSPTASNYWLDVIATIPKLHTFVCNSKVNRQALLQMLVSSPRSVHALRPSRCIRSFSLNRSFIFLAVE